MDVTGDSHQIPKRPLATLQQNPQVIRNNIRYKPSEEYDDISAAGEQILNEHVEEDNQNDFGLTLKVEEQLNKMMKAYHKEGQQVVYSDVWDQNKKKLSQRFKAPAKAEPKKPASEAEGDKFKKMDIKEELKKVLLEKQNEEPKENKLDRFYDFGREAKVNQNVFKNPEIDYEKLLPDSNKETAKAKQDSQVTIESQHESQQDEDLEESVDIDKEDESVQFSEVESEQFSVRVDGDQSQVQSSQVSQAKPKEFKMNDLLGSRQSMGNPQRVFVIEDNSSNANHLRQSKPSSKVLAEQVQKSQQEIIVLNSHLFNSKMRNKNCSFDRSKKIAQEISRLDNNLHKAGPEQLRPRRSKLNSFERRLQKNKRHGNIVMSFQEKGAQRGKNISSMEFVLRKASEKSKNEELGRFPRTSKNQSRRQGRKVMGSLANSHISTEQENSQVSGQPMNKENIFMALMYNRSQKNSSLRDKKNIEKLFLKNQKESKFELSESNCQGEAAKQVPEQLSFPLKKEYIATENTAIRKETLTKQNSPQWSRKRKNRRRAKYRVSARAC